MSYRTESYLIVDKLTQVSCFTIRAHKSQLYADGSNDRTVKFETMLDNRQNFVPQSIGNHKGKPTAISLPYQITLAPSEVGKGLHEGMRFGSLLFAFQQELIN